MTIDVGEAQVRAAQTIGVYEQIDVALHVGGQRYPIDPISEPAFPAAAGLSLDNLRLAVERLQAVRLAGDRPLTRRLGLWAAPDPFHHPETAAVDAELAARYGDPTSEKVFTHFAGLRRKWLAAWRAEHRLPWLASF